MLHQRFPRVMILAAFAAFVLVDCTSSPDATTTNGTDDGQATIGSTGGTVRLADGTRIDVPAGALSSDTTIRVHATDLAPPGAVGPVIAFEPDGTKFDKPVTITLPYAPNEAQGDLLPVAFTGRADGSDLAPIPSTTVDATHLSVTTNHFSIYYVGAVSGGGPVVLASSVNYPGGLVVVGSTVYFVCDGTTDVPETRGLVMSVPLGGGSVANLSGAQNDPKRIASDGTNLYWTNGGIQDPNGGPTGAGVMMLPLAGGTPSMLTASSFPADVAVVGSNLVYTDLDLQTVDVLPEAGGTPVDIATNAQAGDVSVQGANAYVTTRTGDVLSIPLAGGPPAVIASAQANPRGIATDAQSVYWANKDDGTIWKAPLAGGSPTMLIGGQDWPNGVATDGTSVYWTNSGDGTVRRMTVSGGSPVVLAALQHIPQQIALSGQWVVWTTNGDVVFDGSVAKAPK